MKKKVAYVILLLIMFIGGIGVGFYKIFPLPQILAWKQSSEYEPGTFEPGQKVQASSPVQIYETFLQRLLIKKIPLEEFNGSGGAISPSRNLLFFVSNKGSVQTYDLVNHTILKNTITDVPMNILGLVKSAHPYKHGFNIQWFRVNGAYAEFVDDQTYVLFVSHNAYDAERDCITFNISRTQLQLNSGSVSQIGNWKTIFTASPCIDPAPDNLKSSQPYKGHISGGIIAKFDKDHLLVTVGDYDRHGMLGAKEWGMDASNPYGKTITVDKNTGAWQIFTMGNRNATGLYIDSDSLIWSVENGPRGGDELNLLREGANYGWPEVSYGVWYDATVELPGGYKSGTHPVYKKPVFSWVPSVAPRGLTKIEGTKFPYWKGDLLMGTMRDQSLHRLRLNENNKVVYDERIYLGHRIRDLTTLPDDKIALLTDDGYLMIIDDGGPVFNEMDVDAQKRMTLLEKFDGLANNKGAHSSNKMGDNSGRAIFQQHCATCHNLEPINSIGPHLHELFKRKVGSVDNFNYSRSLKTDTTRWNGPHLKSFLEDPENEFPGTKMQKINLSEGEIDSLIQFFQNQKSSE